MKTVISVLVVILLIQGIYSECSENQVNLNTASVSELDGIIYVGEVTAQNIIDTRPFNSIDELINVKGIGDVKLQAIKNEGLACVADSTSSSEEDSEEDSAKPEEETLSKSSDEKSSSETTSIVGDTISSEGSLISLNPQDIKTDENKENNKQNLAIYSLAIFCVLLGVLFSLKFKKRKNEFN